MDVLLSPESVDGPVGASDSPVVWKGSTTVDLGGARNGGTHSTPSVSVGVGHRVKLEDPSSRVCRGHFHVTADDLGRHGGRSGDRRLWRLRRVVLPVPALLPSHPGNLRPGSVTPPLVRPESYRSRRTTSVTTGPRSRRVSSKTRGRGLGQTFSGRRGYLDAGRRAPAPRPGET